MTDNIIPLNVFYMTFTLDTPPDEAAAAFKQRHGQPPQVVVAELGLVKAGPVVEENRQSRRSKDDTHR